ncbi:MAG: 3-deoxy-D-manno-octulosonic acid transferase [Mariprofundaceae bacterium]|nr:3-deoxy-D-manno-octulosonic acid transferase [Mariprofundaceae bacterium]
MQHHPPSRRRQHLALDLPQTVENPVWLHACSVGEVASVAPLVEALLKKNLPIHLTVVTDTGFAHAQKAFGERISIAYLPWDIPGLMRRMITHLNPRLLLLTETEFWPGMLNTCRRRNIPVIGINTRISDRSFPRYQASRLLWKRWLSAVSLFLPASDTDAQRLAALGVEKSRIRSVGHLKYAVRSPDVNCDAIRRRLDSTGNRPIFLAASTHEDEEAQLCRMLGGWKKHAPDLLLVIVPRHPQRFDEVAEMITVQGLQLNRWSDANSSKETSASKKNPDIVLIDEMGVLSGLYSVADIVFIGGSLIPHGGQNPLEAAVCGRGVITGPHMHNFRDIMADLLQTGGAVSCRDAQEVNNAILRFLKHPNELRELHKCAATLMQNKGAVVERMLENIEPWLKS